MPPVGFEPKISAGERPQLPNTRVIRVKIKIFTGEKNFINLNLVRKREMPDTCRPPDLNSVVTNCLLPYYVK